MADHAAPYDLSGLELREKLRTESPVDRTAPRDRTPKTVPGRYIVKLKDGTAAPSATRGTVQALTKSNGGSVRKVFTGALRGYSADLTAAEAKRIAADPDVAYVEPVRRYSISGTQKNPPSWGLDRIDQTGTRLNGAYRYPGTSARGVTAYIIDTGINVAHQDFGGRASNGFDAFGGTGDDCNGHGTHVAGTVGGRSYGVAKDVKLVGVRVLDCDGTGTTEGVVAGIDWVTANAKKPAVANMSLGGGEDPVLDDAVKASIARGVGYVVAAGNDAHDACYYSPARVPAAITVGATDKLDIVLNSSNVGGCLDIFAPGAGITSAWIGSGTAKKSASGTSMAAPHVTGAAAILLAQNPGWSPRQVRDAVVKSGIAGAVFGTFGSIDRLLHVGAVPVKRSSVGLRARFNESLVVAPSGGTKALVPRSWVLAKGEKFDIVPAGGSWVALKSKANNRYVVAPSSGKKPLIAKTKSIVGSAKFKLVHNIDGSISLMAKVNRKWVTAGKNSLIANGTRIGTRQRFDIDAPNPVVSLRATVNKKYVTADGSGTKPLIAKRGSVGRWEKFELVDLGNGLVALRSMGNKRFVAAPSSGRKPLQAKVSSLVLSAIFFMPGTDQNGNIALLAVVNERWVRAEGGGAKPLIAKTHFDARLSAREYFTVRAA
ncbi:S8 family serine peptidase [Melissospora conviva]|uniref:S8 family serine peptidase n=1 Tax=Melissospora conviva TaxID=3388432 RepID=UPI003B774965